MIPNPQQWENRCEEMLETWTKLREEGPELIRLAKMTNQRDGFPRGSMSDRSGSDVSKPTENAGVDSIPLCLRVIDDVMCEHQPEAHREDGSCALCPCAGFMRPATQDLVADWLEEFFAVEAEARGTTRRLGRLEWLVSHRADDRAGRQETGGDCLACTRYVPGSVNDRLKAGYCEACYRAWMRYMDSERRAGRDPSPVAFRSMRQREAVA